LEEGSKWHPINEDFREDEADGMDARAACGMRTSAILKGWQNEEDNFDVTGFGIVHGC
jgi:hypothetical protein